MEKAETAGTGSNNSSDFVSLRLRLDDWECLANCCSGAETVQVGSNAIRDDNTEGYG